MSKKPLKKTDSKKPWAKRTQSKKRGRKNIAIRNLFRIYCEGANTEPEYFRAFRTNPATTHVFVEGLGMSKSALVERVIDKLSKGDFLKGQRNYDSDRKLWIVFDYDWQGEAGECSDYIRAREIAENKGIKVADSNDAFEVWFVLHFQYMDTNCHRKILYKILTDRLGFNYEKEGKKKETSKKLFNILLPFREDAIRNAKTLFDIQKMKYLQNPCDCNPFTRVHLLVQELIKAERSSQF